MTFVLPGPDYNKREFHIRYTCSLSPALRAVIKASEVDIAPYIEDVVEDIDGNEEVATSLKHSIPGMATVRQIDIKKDTGQVLFKCFVEWIERSEMWLVAVEGANETFWEDYRGQYGQG